MSGSCEAVENDASDERDRPSRDDIERRVRQLIDELALTPTAISVWAAGNARDHRASPIPR